MTTTLTCEHISSARCLLCSDERPWFREARRALGYGEEPPNGLSAQAAVQAAEVIVRRRGRPPKPADRIWDELSTLERRVLIAVGASTQGLEMALYKQIAWPALRSLQRRGLCGVDPEDGRWYLGTRGKAVLESGKSDTPER